MSDSTRRERVTDRLIETQATASELADELATPVSTIYTDIQHVARSTQYADDTEFLVAPPECINCGFSGYDDPINYPSRCPECRSENIEEAVFKIDAE
ncbi:MAG: putative transcriptional regulator containing an HTH domain fused to a Zn-ribbon [Halonotius sp. J07HN4]|jgi:Predicted transcriptional regulator containing an HTH domain fused to a Zn-ribbon|nr:MAG: putative transcriptional regulator containing an HTH domain fused to a Zn-ribbon [Halonotius sp. J07HN4]ESS07948.1 MAG: putative transcriptional regulator containing an HTH domain fused to a Zn-ribbon [uncultured archaeon A07HN63]